MRPFRTDVRGMAVAVTAGVVVVLLAGCGVGPSPYEALGEGYRTPTTASTTVPPSTDPSVSLPGSGTPVTTSATQSAGSPTGSAGTTAAAGSGTGSGVPLLTAPSASAGVPTMIAQAGNAGQAVVVTASSLNASAATLTAYQRTGTTWTASFGPWPARIGSRGFAPAGEKREGDDRTPSGSFEFDFLFGVEPDPGVKFPYLLITSSIVWVDDANSPLYNQWADRNLQQVPAGGEQMYQPQAYRHGAVIAYNSARTPNLGSTIFLHASTGAATAGGVSIGVDFLIQLLKWLDPAQSPRIVMGVG